MIKDALAPDHSQDAYARPGTKIVESSVLAPILRKYSQGSPYAVNREFLREHMNFIPSQDILGGVSATITQALASKEVSVTGELMGEEIALLLIQAVDTILERIDEKEKLYPEAGSEDDRKLILAAFSTPEAVHRLQIINQQATAFHMALESLKRSPYMYNSFITTFLQLASHNRYPVVLHRFVLNHLDDINDRDAFMRTIHNCANNNLYNLKRQAIETLCLKELTLSPGIGELIRMLRIVPARGNYFSEREELGTAFLMIIGKLRQAVKEVDHPEDLIATITRVLCAKRDLQPQVCHSIIASILAGVLYK